jgi:hypothetical protein
MKNETNIQFRKKGERKTKEEKRERGEMGREG